MAKPGLRFIHNVWPNSDEKFLRIEKYAFFPNIKKGARITIIELEIYEFQICILSFYSKGVGNKETRYKIRNNLGPGQILGILKACLEAFNLLQGGYYALIFSAANDLKEAKEDNARNSCYNLFISYGPHNYDHFIKQGVLHLNTLLMHDPSYQFPNEAKDFFKKFQIKLQEELNLTV